MIMTVTTSDGSSGNDYNNSGSSGCNGRCLVLWWEVVVMYSGSFGDEMVVAARGTVVVTILYWL